MASKGHADVESITTSSHESMFEHNKHLFMMQQKFLFRFSFIVCLILLCENSFRPYLIIISFCLENEKVHGAIGNYLSAKYLF